VLLVTALRGRDDRIRGVEVGADGFLAKPPDWQELIARVQSMVRLKRYTDDMESAEAVILGLAMTIEIRDPYTEGHCQRLANYATALGERLGLPREDLQALYRGGFLHDLGKIGVPDAILLKPGPLTDAEFEVVKQHPVIGSKLCEGLRTLHRALPIIRSHHERLDGSGYPDGLAGDAVPLLAQILSIVDIYAALTTPRPYKPALSRAQAHGTLRDEARRQWRRTDLDNRPATAATGCCGRGSASKGPEPIMTEPMRVLVTRDHLCGCLLSSSLLQAMTARGWELNTTLTDDAAVAALEAETAEVCVIDRADPDSTLRFLAATRGCGRAARGGPRRIAVRTRAGERARPSPGGGSAQSQLGEASPHGVMRVGFRPAADVRTPRVSSDHSSSAPTDFVSPD
jgi:hypothetical protein